MRLRDRLERETLERIGFRGLVAVQRGAQVRDAVRAMQEAEVGACCVLDGRRLIGLFTEHHLAASVLGEELDLDVPVAARMLRDPAVARPRDPLHVVLARMHKSGLRHLPVVDDAGEPIGMTSIKRAVRLLGVSAPAAVYNVPPEPGQFPERAEGA